MRGVRVPRAEHLVEQGPLVVVEQVRPLLVVKMQQPGQLEQVAGDTLEVGIGTGLNLPLYPAAASLTGIDISPAMLKIAADRARQLGRGVDLHQADAQALPFPAGDPDAYSTDYSNFACDNATRMETQAKFADTIYSRDDRGVFVNLFIPSEVRCADRGVTLRQTTGFPDDPAVSIEVMSGAAAFTLRLARLFGLSHEAAIRYCAEMNRIGEGTGLPPA